MPVISASKVGLYSSAAIPHDSSAVCWRCRKIEGGGTAAVIQTSNVSYLPPVIDPFMDAAILDGGVWTDLRNYSSSDGLRCDWPFVTDISDWKPTNWLVRGLGMHPFPSVCSMMAPHQPADKLCKSESSEIKGRKEQVQAFHWPCHRLVTHVINRYHLSGDKGKICVRDVADTSHWPFDIPTAFDTERWVSTGRK